MKQTARGFKQPTVGDPADLYQFVGDNMDTLESELDKRPEGVFHKGTTPPADRQLLWIDPNS